MKIPANGFTHAGKFHADDVFATALLQIIRPDIRITRGFVVPDDFDGIVYDIGFGMFDHLSYFKTHYYGGIRKYQWGTMPLAIHGVFTRADGSSMSFSVGEDENDPVFCITDLLPHLGAEQNDRKLSDGIKAEELNVLIGSDAVEEEDVKEAVKLNTLILLHEKYGSTLIALHQQPCIASYSAPVTV